MAKQSKPKSTPEKPPTEKLKKMKIRVNEFGQIIKDFDTEEINAFLDEHVKDKKFETNDEL